MINEYQAPYRVSRTVWGLVAAGLIVGTVALVVGVPVVDLTAVTPMLTPTPRRSPFG
jgi:hypothetical protein